MPTRKPSAPVKSPAALAPKPKKKSTPSPPSPHEQDRHEKPHKSGKKEAHKHVDKPRGKHLRRVYEHLGRVQTLQSLAEVESIPSLVHLAQAGIDQDQARSAADLLRAAEHLGFAAAAAKSNSGAALSPDLEEAIRREFRKLLEAAEDHDLPQNSTLGVLLRQTLVDARSAFDADNFRQALELARAAEALAGIDAEIADEFNQPQATRSLKR